MCNWRDSKLRSRQALGLARNNIDRNAVLLRNMDSCKGVGMTVETQIAISHRLRFAAVLGLMCMIPAYSFTHWPAAMVVAAVCESGAILACAVGTGLWIRKFIRGWVSYRKASLRPGRVTAQLVLTVTFILLCIGRIAYRPSIGLLMAVIALVIAVVLGAGAWLLGLLLQWLWRVTTPHDEQNQRFTVAHGGAGVTRS